MTVSFRSASGGALTRRCGIALVALAIVVMAAPAGAQPDPPALTDTVNDFAGVIDASAKQQLDTLSRQLQSASGDALVVATIKTFEPWGDITTYAAKMFENHGRGIGQQGRDNGLLVLLAVDNRRVWVEVGYDLEAFITDGFAGETSREVMTPYFRQGDYGGGLVAGAGTIAHRIAEARNVTLEGVPAPRRQARRETGGPPIIVWVIIAIVVFNAIRNNMGPPSSGRRRRGRWNSHVGPFGAGYGGWSSGGGGGGFGGGFGGFGGGRSGGGGGGASW